METIHAKNIASIFCWLILSQVAVADNPIAPQSMVVITAIDRPLQHQRYAERVISAAQGNFAVYDLNAVRAFEANFSQGLPKDEREATKTVQQRLAHLGKETFKQQLLAAYEGLLFAVQYRIDRYPAIIFDQHFVIYGVTDLKVALQKYRQWIRQQKNVVPEKGVAP